MKPELLLVLPLCIVRFSGLALAVTDPGFQYTFLAGALPETLHVEDSPFMVLANVYTVAETHIDPGVEIQFTGGTSLRTNAYGIKCLGTEEEPVYMHDAGLGIWDWIVLDNPYGAERFVQFSHTIIEGATLGIHIYFTSASANTHTVLDHVTVMNCPGAGLMLEPSGENPQIGELSIVGLSATGNTNGIYIHGGFSSGQISLTGQQVSGNEIGIVIESPTTVTDCLISGNTTYGVYVDWTATVQYCSISDNGEYDVRVATPVETWPSLDFRFNDWGPTTTAEMEAEGLFSDISTIFDWWDSSSRSIVDYAGFSGGSTGVQSANVVPTSWGAVKSLFK